MSTTSPASEPVSQTLLTAGRTAVVEQVMRTCDDELQVLPFLAVEPGTRAASAALGRLLSSHPVRLVGGCPLISFVAGAELDPEWRDACPARPSSLWASLQFLRTLYGPDPTAEDPYEELETLRRREESDLGAAAGATLGSFGSL